MELEFKDKSWNFLEVSKTYIKGDVQALYQILVSYFEGIQSKFPIDPIQSLSVPGIAFTTWKTVQLPKLHVDNLQVYDLSKSSNPLFREAYLGGIVDVYRPHLTGKGYYYDVNSLYPTAMCKTMPRGAPSKVDLSVAQFLEGYFFGFVKARVQAPDNEYLGLLPIKLNGRLVCPAGPLKGYFSLRNLDLPLLMVMSLILLLQPIAFKEQITHLKI